MYGAAAAAAGAVVGRMIGQYVAPIAKKVLNRLNYMVDATTAFVKDRLYGPLREFTVLGRGVNETSNRLITVRAYRFNKVIGNSYTLSKNMIHTDIDTLNALIGHPTATTARLAADWDRNSSFEIIVGTGFGSGAERHIAHEIGHTAQARRLGIFYLPIVAPMTSFKSIPLLNRFERDASDRGRYGGIK